MKFPIRSFALFALVVTALAKLASPAWAAVSSNRVDVILWFDTEDYLLPADDDASKRLAEMLTQRGIRATFKIVGEKARVLEKRGRRDVIEALRKHDIGYHANFHSVHPTPSEYLADCGLLDGVSEFVRREGPGAADVRRIFGVPTLSCYGQPGSSWGSQTIVGLKEIGVAPHGVPCYVDEGDHVGLNERPFWYGSALIVYHMGRNYTRMELHDASAVEPAKEKVSEIASRLHSQGGGLISIFYHPCEWVHREFWDGVNFRRGANPPREQWTPPPQRSEAETEGAFARFGQYIDYIRALPGVRFVTAGDLPTLYSDPVRKTGAPQSDLDAIAQNLALSPGQTADFIVIQNRAYSLADQFELLTKAVGEKVEGRSASFPLAASGLFGPDAQPPSEGVERKISWFAFRDATRDVLNYIKAEGRVPARVFIGPDSISPLQFLTALASVYASRETPAQVELRRPPKLGPEKKIAADTPGLFGGWVIHKEGFRAPKILEVARLQSWTLKPAIRD